MTTPYEIPLVAAPQEVGIILGGVQYTLNVWWNDFTNVWVVDMYDATGTVPILTGIPLVTGVDLLGQYEYMDFGGMLIAQSDGDIYAPPTFSTLGTTSHLYFVTTP
jgi:hypothetical protein